MTNKQKYFGIGLAFIMSPFMAVGFVAHFAYYYVESGWNIADICFEEFGKWLSE